MRLINLTKVRSLFTLSHRGSDNSPLLFVFSANYIDQSIVTLMRLRFRHLQKYCTAFKVRYLIGRNHNAIYAKTFHTKFTWTRSVMESTQIIYAIAKIEVSLSSNCDSVNIGLTLVRLYLCNLYLLYVLAAAWGNNREDVLIVFFVNNDSKRTSKAIELVRQVWLWLEVNGSINNDIKSDINAPFLKKTNQNDCI